MRLLILGLALVVVALSASILLASPPPDRPSATFPATRFIEDATPGETAVYRDGENNKITFRVEGVLPGSPDSPPVIRIRRELQDHTGRPLPGGNVAYDHDPTRHWLFPLTAPSDPKGYDRVWVWRRIQRAPIDWRGRERQAWKVDALDPAMRPEAGADHVVAWFDESVPVFGLLTWQHRGRTWELIQQVPE